MQQSSVRVNRSGSVFITPGSATPTLAASASTPAAARSPYSYSRTPLPPSSYAGTPPPVPRATVFTAAPAPAPHQPQPPSMAIETASMEQMMLEQNVIQQLGRLHESSQSAIKRAAASQHAARSFERQAIDARSQLREATESNSQLAAELAAAQSAVRRNEAAARESAARNEAQQRAAQGEAAAALGAAEVHLSTHAALRDEIAAARTREAELRDTVSASTRDAAHIERHAEAASTARARAGDLEREVMTLRAALAASQQAEIESAGTSTEAIRAAQQQSRAATSRFEAAERELGSARAREVALQRAVQSSRIETDSLQANNQRLHADLKGQLDVAREETTKMQEALIVEADAHVQTQLERAARREKATVQQLRDEASSQVTTLRSQLERQATATATALARLEAEHCEKIADLREQFERARATEVSAVAERHATQRAALQGGHARELQQLKEEMGRAMRSELEESASESALRLDASLAQMATQSAEQQITALAASELLVDELRERVAHLEREREQTEANANAQIEQLLQQLAAEQGSHEDVEKRSTEAVQRQLRERRAEVEAFGNAIKNMEMEAETRQFELEQAIATLQARLADEQEQHVSSRTEHASISERKARLHKEALERHLAAHRDALASQQLKHEAQSAMTHGAHLDRHLNEHRSAAENRLEQVVAQLGALHREEVKVQSQKAADDLEAQARRVQDEVSRANSEQQRVALQLERCQAKLDEYATKLDDVQEAHRAKLDEVVAGHRALRDEKRLLEEESVDEKIAEQQQPPFFAAEDAIRTKQLEAAQLMQDIEATVFDAVDELSSARDAALNERMRLLSNAVGVSLATLEASVLGKSNGLAVHLYAARAETRRVRDAFAAQGNAPPGALLSGVLAAMFERFRANVAERVDVAVAGSALASVSGMSMQSVGIARSVPNAMIEPDDARVAELAAALIEAAGTSE